MDLQCRETVNSSDLESIPGSSSAPRNNGGQDRPTRRALVDPALLNERVLNTLLRLEERHTTRSEQYFESVQNEITVDMRRIVACWMLEVCEEQQCQEEVFSLAMSYMDRFLAVCRIGKTELQLLGTTCLLLASKLREPNTKCLPVELLVFYTDNSITSQDLCKWELLVLTKLKWDVSTVTPQDFLLLFMSRLPLKGLVDQNMVIQHAQTFISFAAREYAFTVYTPSTLAAASIANALRGLGWGVKFGSSFVDLITKLHQISGVEQDYLQTCAEQIENMIQKSIAIGGSPNLIAGAAMEEEIQKNEWSSQPQTMVTKHLDNSTTPTDVRDVQF